MSTICKPSAVKTADAIAVIGPGALCGIMVATDGTNSVTVDLYDNASTNSGTKLIPSWVVTTSSISRAQALEFANPIKFANGVYVDITTSGTCSYVVYYR